MVNQRAGMHFALLITKSGELSMLHTMGKGFLVLALLLAAWIAINSVDEEPRYDQSLILPQVDVPDEQNGYALLRDLDKSGDKSLLLSQKDSQRLRDIVIDWEWDRQFAERVLVQHAGAMELVKQVVARPRFITDKVGNIYDGLANYSRILELQKIVLLKARLDEDNDNYTDAIESAKLAMQYCEKIRMDEQGYLVSYIIGWSCISNVIDFYHELVSNHPLVDYQLKSIEEGMVVVAEYGKDNFDRVLRRELSQIKYNSQWYDRYSMIERLYIAHDAVKKKIICYSCKYSFMDISYAYFNAIFAKYYWHANEVMNSNSSSYEEVISYSTKKCSSIDSFSFFEDSLYYVHDSKKVIDFIVPGSASSYFFSGSFKDYPPRRCGYYNYYSAVKGFVAMARYRVAHDGVYPDSLQQLIPDYLKILPEDFFGKSGLQYDFGSRRFYSVGIKHDNSSASDAGFYKGRCYHTAKPPESICELSPAFPVSWNEYKFYETLRKAESGDQNAQRQLGWFYNFGKYTTIDPEKAVYWYSKAAEKHDAHAEYLLGFFYEPKGNSCSAPGPTAAFEDGGKALGWYRKSYEDGSSLGANAYAGYLLSGKGGERDLHKAMQILADKATKAGVDYSGSLLYLMRNGRILGGHDVLVSAWADYYLEHPELLAGFATEKLSGEQFMHQLLADNLWYNSYLYNASTDEEKSKMEKWAANLREHYAATNDEEGERKLDELVADRSKPIPEEKPENRNMCKLVFDHRHEDMANFQAVQEQIFQDKRKAKKLVASFNKEMAFKYQGLNLPDPFKNGGLSLNFLSIDIKSLIILLFDVADFDSRDSALQFNDGISDTRGMIHGDNFHLAVAINLLLDDLGLGAECNDGKVRIFIENPDKLKPKILTEDFIVDWSGVKYHNGSLQGAGTLIYSGGLKYKGEVVGSLPNGKGEYVLSGAIFYGDNFVDGLLEGNGHRAANGHDEERGEYSANVLNGSGEIAYGYGGMVYKGKLKNGSYNGAGTVTYNDVGDLRATYMPIEHNYPPTWSFSGNFTDGGKTTGNCAIYHDRKVVDSFSCEFYQDALVKVGDVSLMPPGITVADLQKYIP